MFKILVYFVGMYIVPVNVRIAGGTYNNPQLAGVFLPIHHLGHRVFRQMTLTRGALAPFIATFLVDFDL